jgi:2-alkyl-3-oxoalkanoate reductase
MHEMTAIPALSTARSRKRVKAQTTRRRYPVPLTAGRVRTAGRRAKRFVCSGRRPAVAPAHEQGNPAATAPLEGLALRYGNLYGPGSFEVFIRLLRRRQVPLVGSGAGVWSFLHVTDAAAATVAAVLGGAPGVYNIVDDEPATVAEWLPVVARAAGAKAPLHVPAWLGRLAAGEAGLSMMTQVRGCSNAKAKRELGWQPVWPSWRTGFEGGLAQAYPAAGAVS